MSSSNNIYTKINQIRFELSITKFKKSGHNDFANFDYFELSDFMPKVIELQDKYGVCSHIMFEPEKATLTIVNCENPEEKLVFAAPCTEIEVPKGNKLQALGGVQTYMRRYLYMAAYEITEPETFDRNSGKNKQTAKQQPKQNKPIQANPTEDRDKLKNVLWNKIKLASELQGKSPKEMMAEIAKQYGKDITNFTNEELKKSISVIDLLMQSSTADMNKL